MPVCWPSSCPLPPTNVPSLRISTTLSGKIRKYCHTACDESTQSSFMATGLSGNTRSALISDEYLLSASSGPWTLARIRFTLTNTMDNGEKIIRSYGMPLVPGSSTTLPRRSAQGRASIAAFFGGRPLVIPAHPRFHYPFPYLHHHPDGVPVSWNGPTNSSAPS